MKLVIATLVAAFFLVPHQAKAVNYQHILCDDEPDPEVCQTIQQ